jgi:hypothetical protein
MIVIAFGAGALIHYIHPPVWIKGVIIATAVALILSVLRVWLRATEREERDFARTSYRLGVPPPAAPEPPAPRPSVIKVLGVRGIVIWLISFLGIPLIVAGAMLQLHWLAYVGLAMLVFVVLLNAVVLPGLRLVRH